MILSNDEMTRFEFRGNSYPLRCDLLVLEKIQNLVGDIVDAGYKLRGFVPRVDRDGVVDTTTGRYTYPDIKVVTQSLVWMMDEAKEVTGGNYTVPTTKELKQQDDYTLAELALFAYNEYGACLAGKKKTTRQQLQKKSTATETQQKRR